MELIFGKRKIITTIKDAILQYQENMTFLMQQTALRHHQQLQSVPTDSPKLHKDNAVIR